MFPEITTIGVMLLSLHAKPGFNTFTPGLYVVTKSGYMAAGFANSHENPAGVLARKWDSPVYGSTVPVNLSILAGAAVGYGKPMLIVSPSVAIHFKPATLRLSYVPRQLDNPHASEALTISFEQRL